MTSLTRGTNEYLQRVKGLSLAPEAKEAIVDVVMKNPQIMKQYIVGLGRESGVTMASYARRCNELEGRIAGLDLELKNMQTENRTMRNQIKHYERMLEYDRIRL